MANPAKHNDPFDSLDDLDDEFVDYRAKLDTEDDYAVDSYVAETPVRDQFAEDFDDEPVDLQRQAFAAPAAPLGLREPAGLHVSHDDDDIGAISIPRIAIHFFPDSEASVAACDAAALDRRMSRAQSLVRRGGIEEAIETYRHEPTPSLIFVESQ